MTLPNLSDLGHETVPHPPYSSALSSTDYLFSHASGHFFYAKKTYGIKWPC